MGDLRRLLHEAASPADDEALLLHELRSFFLQEVQGDDAGPTAPGGLYTAFDMDRDHSGTWYRSPGRPAGEDGDPGRSADPYAQLGFRAPGGDGSPEGTTTLAPPIWQLSAGSDTSSVLGANAKPAGGGVGSGDEQEAPEDGTDPERTGVGGGADPEEGEAEGEEQGRGGAGRGRD